MYFAGDVLNETDRLLQSAPEDARDLLTVDFDDTGGVPHGHFPIVLAKVV